jgi:hypothetical protein
VVAVIPRCCGLHADGRRGDGWLLARTAATAGSARLARARLVVVVLGEVELHK